MARIFLDTNIFIDLVEKRKQITLDELNANNLFISPLSAHILMYIAKRKIPYQRLNNIINSFMLVPFDESITNSSLVGPTNDLEDNIQLHSAAEADCDIFLTSDAKLLNLKFFGKVQILPQISL